MKNIVIFRKGLTVLNDLLIQMKDFVLKLGHSEKPEDLMTDPWVTLYSTECQSIIHLISG